MAELLLGYKRKLKRRTETRKLGSDHRMENVNPKSKINKHSLAYLQSRQKYMRPILVCAYSLYNYVTRSDTIGNKVSVWSF